MIIITIRIVRITISYGRMIFEVSYLDSDCSISEYPSKIFKTLGNP